MLLYYLLKSIFCLIFAVIFITLHPHAVCMFTCTYIMNYIIDAHCIYVHTRLCYRSNIVSIVVVKAEVVFSFDSMQFHRQPL